MNNLVRPLGHPVSLSVSNWKSAPRLLTTASSLTFSSLCLAFAWTLFVITIERLPAVWFIMFCMSGIVKLSKFAFSTG
ncbi:hypothetical protein QBC35DRAFT_493685 [Podospora australis]|uniref:Uncharacterized protein n=1 Tax=Podospora australis TaxID=1536484 RepID=A0AAN6WW63_9PEZI|nr:hypothetical protein QBC35DRAFT_493685 [Podospora australis]